MAAAGHGGTRLPPTDRFSCAKDTPLAQPKHTGTSATSGGLHWACRALAVSPTLASTLRIPGPDASIASAMKLILYETAQADG